MGPRFSVLLPTHNRADVLPLAIRSVLAQTETDFELFVVADGCTDNTVEVVAGFDDPRLRLFDLPKAPFFGYSNRNLALREAKGRYVAYMAHDDLILPDHLVLLGETLDRRQADWAYSRPLWVSPDGLVVPFAVNLNNPEELTTFLTQGNSIPASCVVHLRSCLDRYGYWPEDVPEAADWRYWIRMIEGGERRNFAFCAVPTVLHFRAIWRTTATFGPPPLPALLELASTSSWWPSSMREAVPQGKTEQAEFLRRMETETNWASQLRADISRVIDHLGWRYGLDIPRLRARDAHIEALEMEREGLVQEVKRYRKILAPLGVLRRRLAPPLSLRERMWTWVKRRVIKP